MKKHALATTIVSLYLLVYILLFHFEAPWMIIASMFLLSPFLVIWMAYSILKHSDYDNRELAENEEWGYQDKPAEFGKKLNQRYS